MGFYYDYLQERWSRSISDHHLTREAYQRIARRETLIEGLLAELEDRQDGVAWLYASGLARALVASDELLMRRYGRQVAEITASDMRPWMEGRNRVRFHSEL